MLPIRYNSTKVGDGIWWAGFELLWVGLSRRSAPVGQEGFGAGGVGDGFEERGMDGGLVGVGDGVVVSAAD